MRRLASLFILTAALLAAQNKIAPGREAAITAHNSMRTNARIIIPS